jgi:uncharacterized membrane protein YdfJ with MMPL/SSD domain
MFAALARFSEKYKIWIFLFWGGLAIALMLLSPSLSEVGVTDDAQFLPKDTQSTLAQRLLETRFAGSAAAPAGSALIVVHDSQGLSPGQRDRQ